MATKINPEFIQGVEELFPTKGSGSDNRVNYVESFMALADAALARHQLARDSKKKGVPHDGPKMLAAVLEASTVQEAQKALKACFNLEEVRAHGFRGNGWLTYDKKQLTYSVLHAMILTRLDERDWVLSQRQATVAMLDTPAVPTAKAVPAAKPVQTVKAIAKPVQVADAEAIDEFAQGDLIEIMDELDIDWKTCKTPEDFLKAFRVKGVLLSALLLKLKDIKGMGITPKSTKKAICQRLVEELVDSE